MQEGNPTGLEGEVGDVRFTTVSAKTNKSIKVYQKNGIDNIK